MLSPSCAGPTRVEAPSPGFSLPPRTLFNFINWLLSHSLAGVVVGGSERGWAWPGAPALLHHSAPLLPAGTQPSCPVPLYFFKWPEAGGWRLEAVTLTPVAGLWVVLCPHLCTPCFLPGRALDGPEGLGSQCLSLPPSSPPPYLGLQAETGDTHRCG